MTEMRYEALKGYKCDSRCKCGKNPTRETLDKDYLDNRISLQDYADKICASKMAVHRHVTGHLPEALLKATNIKEIATADNLLDQLKSAREKALSLLDKAEQAGDTRVYGPPSAYLKEIREQIKLLAELEGRLAVQPQINFNRINIYDSPEWIKVGQLLARVLEPYSELRTEVAKELLVLYEAHK